MACHYQYFALEFIIQHYIRTNEWKSKVRLSHQNQTVSVYYNNNKLCKFVQF